MAHPVWRRGGIQSLDSGHIVVAGRPGYTQLQRARPSVVSREPSGPVVMFLLSGGLDDFDLVTAHPENAIHRKPTLPWTKKIKQFHHPKECKVDVILPLRHIAELSYDTVDSDLTEIWRKDNSVRRNIGAIIPESFILPGITS